MLRQKSFQTKQKGPHIFEPTGPNAPHWYVVDAEGMIVGRLASAIARVITGKHKPTYTRHADAGDFVVVLNADKVRFTADKMDTKIYRDYSGYVSGLKEKTAREMLNRHPEEIIRRAVWGMTPKSTLARHQMKKLKIYASGEHPHVAQNPKALPAFATRRTVLQKKTA